MQHLALDQSLRLTDDWSLSLELSYARRDGYTQNEAELRLSRYF